MDKDTVYRVVKDAVRSLQNMIHGDGGDLLSYDFKNDIHTLIKFVEENIDKAELDINELLAYRDDLDRRADKMLMAFSNLEDEVNDLSSCAEDMSAAITDLEDRV